MKFKIDENLPKEYVALLRNAGFGADTVDDEGLAGATDEALARQAAADERVLITLDLDFANIHAYPPTRHAGIMVLRAQSQDKITLLALLRKVLAALRETSPERQLWIVEPDRIRVREV